jgi:SAM-dependent methyltransferase
MMEDYQHPPTFCSTGDISADFQHTAEDYDLNVAPYLPQNRNSRIIDVGCGWGQFLWWIRNRGYRAAEGIDLGSVQVQQCRTLGLEAQQVTDSASFLKERPGQYDVVTMHHIIEHMDAPTGLNLLRAAHHSLPPGGRIIVQTPNMSAISAGYLRHIEMTHVTGYADSSLGEALLMAGFHNVIIFGNKTPFRLSPRRLLWLGLQAASRLVWRTMLFAELGTDAPRILQKNLYAIADRS